MFPDVKEIFYLEPFGSLGESRVVVGLYKGDFVYGNALIAELFDFNGAVVSNGCKDKFDFVSLKIGLFWTFATPPLGIIVLPWRFFWQVIFAK